MKYSYLMLTFLYGLIICGGVWASGEPKCKLNEDLNANDMADEEHEHLDDSVVTLPFKFIGHHLKQELHRLRDNMAVLNDVNQRSNRIVQPKRKLPVQRGVLSRMQASGIPEVIQEMTRRAFNQLEDSKNITELLPSVNLESLINHNPLNGANHVVFYKVHTLKLANQTLSVIR
ncbi:uncharacterized protein LOC108048999 [Drosophila rhopaloa]|uniref:Uncharacterized protein LOC108048999 n=1 Tax=Drosophila rhopaloa TaxID=1041015 RepID=A0A6P4F571_DRORH|nr:uncharacterized protein LOC108048999 [Drosophila rhopaloa]